MSDSFKNARTLDSIDLGLVVLCLLTALHGCQSCSTLHDIRDDVRALRRDCSRTCEPAQVRTAP